ncbi:MAG: acetyl-CoA carboxylase, biotin carboxyl carrier protein, partial [Bacteroidota bacterium]
MNKKEIEELIRFVSKSGVSEVSLEQKDFKITIKNAPREMQVVTAAAPAVVQMAPPVAAPAATPVAAPAAPAPAAKATDESKYHVVKSPM